MSDRMLSDEILLGLIKKNGGGGGGTNNYNNLDNLPQIGGVTLRGNKTASDLGLATENALANKVDKVEGKGLSTNDYTNDDKAIVSRVTAALAGKQNVTDNNLDTEAKTIVGAINEHEGDISSLKSGLTDLSEEVNGDATVYPYADVITIEDAVPANLADCSVKIEPVQDLHGQSAPWVGGAGKNKLNNNYYAGSSFIQSNVTITKNTDGSLDVTINGSCSGTVNYMFLNTDAGSGLKAGSYKAILKAEGTYTGNVLFVMGGGESGIPRAELSPNVASNTFTIANDDDTLHYCLLQFPAGATVTGTLKIYPMIADASADMTIWAPYENICPITGHTEASVQRDGVNLFDSSDLTEIASGLGDCVKAPIKSGNIYTISANPAEGSSRPWLSMYLYIDGGWSHLADFSPEMYDTKYTFTAPEGATKVCINGANYTTRFPQCELGSVKTPYEPYAGKTYTIALGDTIYGGTVDFDSGVMTVTHGIVDLGSLSWTKYQTVYYTEVSDSVVGIERELPSIKCSCYKTVTTVTGQTQMLNKDDASITNNASYNRLYVKDTTNYADATEFTTAMDGMTATYELATPTTIQLTPQQIQLLKGQNTLTASTGQISVTVNGVSGAIGAVQEQVNGLAEEVAEIKPNHVVLDIAPNTYSTYADVMEALYTAYNALSDDEKTRSYIVYANLYIYHMNDTYNAQFTRVDSKIETNGYKLITQVFNCREKKVLAFTTSSAGVLTSDDYSLSAQSQRIKLCY